MKFTLLTLAILFNVIQAQASSKIDLPWDSYSDPARMSQKYEKLFSALPLSGKVKDATKYWSSDYWPLFKGNINYRWNSPEPRGFNLNSPSKSQALKMTQDELKQLAPSEKYDLFTGNYHYPLKLEVKKRTSPRHREWEGICHGWAAAALNHAEPVPRVVSNPDGLQIPFGSSDIKALLSYYYAYKYDPDGTHQMGRRCNGTNYCNEDLNAGAFHIVLTNQVGISKESFINDIENGREVWNQVVYHYQSQVMSRNNLPTSSSASGTVKVIRMKSKVRVVMNIVKNSWEAANGTPFQTFRDNEYEYDLDLDRAGMIIGGEWRSTARPDFLWFVKPVSHFSGLFSKLPRLLR